MLKEWFAKVLLRRFGLEYVEKALALIPGNGAKTILSTVVTSIAISVLVVSGSTADSLLWIKDILIRLGGEQIATSAEISAVVGCFGQLISVFHKWLKKLKAISEGAA